jgi:hypothetical protein
MKNILSRFDSDDTKKKEPKQTSPEVIQSLYAGTQAEVAAIRKPPVSTDPFCDDGLRFDIDKLTVA